MKIKELGYLLKCDLFRISGNDSVRYFLRQLFFGESFKYIFWMRLTGYLRNSAFYLKPAFIVSYFILKHYRYKFGIYIPDQTKIGRGFYIGHFGGIIINPDCIIGNNCNISHGVTLGSTSRGSKKGSPVIGDNVYIGPGAKIIGAVRIGNNAAVGANCVVTKDIADNSVAVGIPATVISSKGSEGYINNIRPGR